MTGCEKGIHFGTRFWSNKNSSSSKTKTNIKNSYKRLGKQTHYVTV